MSPRRLAVVSAGTVALVLMLGLLVARPWLVHGGSMAPQVPDGSLVVADDLGPAVDGYRRGDIVVLSTPASQPDVDLPFMLKRVVGVPGDHLRIRDGRVFVNGAPLLEPYLTASEADGIPSGDQAELTVPPGEVFVLGDNRGHSRDSKAFGPVPVAALHGRVWLIVAPGGVAAPTGLPAAEATSARP